MSETGVVPLDDGEVIEKGRLGPGQMINVDLKTGEFKVSFSPEPTSEWTQTLA